MKIRTRKVSYDKVLTLKPYANQKPLKQWWILRKLVYVVSLPTIWGTRFKANMINMEKLPDDQPCLILMNHSSFTDMKIIATLFHKRSYQIICTLDGMIGKKWLMKFLGCIPTKKFISDPALVRDMVYTTKELKSSIVMYPEASYSFDGTATTLPDSMGKLLKILKVPVVMVRTYGAFHRDPLYNGLQIRKTRVSADVEYLLSPDDIKEKTPAQLNQILKKAFDFDQFRWQQENQVRVAEKFRADGLNRVLYKCPHCLTEGKMLGKGTTIICEHCKKEYELTEYGKMQAVNGDTEIDHIPDWYKWERDCVRKELLDHTYHLDVPVDIYMLIDTKCIYKVGEGQLTHTKDGFTLVGCDGKLNYAQAPESSYSLYSDFFWYEIGDVICIGNAQAQYYCFPKGQKDIVAKTRLAAEELYKITMAAKAKKHS